eukprot:TRINITY_DN13451_c0_g2_i2.p1 TRINITY_DN13451_c0_g2~~TRINITY_DN13451_c0_g2_i2.p1  ORF type:complete len:646 (+),score=118.67 TRINITY_DN13451_c0_g2_i2:115-2052(+)
MVGAQPEEAGDVFGASGNGTSSAAVEGRTLNHIAGPLPEDPGARIASRVARLLVFVFLCQGVQMFMSYDGGAVPASLDTLQDLFNHSWSELEIGLLGAMDKVGMVAAAVPWGWALERCNAKILLTISLLLNAVITFFFGWLPTKTLMFLAKFILGATQSLQGVWGTVWTMNMAPPDKKTMWLGLGAVSAGVGNGIGTCVAGFGTANGLRFAFAFELAGGILGSLWILQIFIPARYLDTNVASVQKTSSNKNENLAIHSVESGLQQSPQNSPDSRAGSMPAFTEQLQILGANHMYIGTALAISLGLFEASGIQYLWTRAFTEIWMVGPQEGLSKNWVTAMLVVVAGTGGGLGVFLGPWFIDRKGGFQQLPGIQKTLGIIWWLQVAAALAGLGGVGALYGKFHPWYYTGDWGDIWLWLTWLCIFIIFAAHNASVAALCGICLQVIPAHMRTFGSGTEIAVRNILGYICGPLLPSIVMQLNAGSSGWLLSLGLGFVFCANSLGVLVLGRLRREAKLALAAEQEKILQELRLALQAQDVSKLEQAVAAARRVELEQADVLGMANELIGLCHAREGPAPSVQVDLAEDLQDRIAVLQQQVVQQQQEILDLRLRLAQATQPGSRRVQAANCSSHEFIGVDGCANENGDIHL